MPTLRTTVDDFYLLSEYYCKTTVVTIYTDTTHGTIQSRDYSTTTSEATSMRQSVRFGIDIPKNATIVKAAIHATLGTPLHGAEISTINGVSVGTGRDCEVDVTNKVKTAVDEGNSDISVYFALKINAEEHHHDPYSEMDSTGSSWMGDRILNEYFQKRHYGTLKYTNIYLLIEVEGVGDCIYHAENGALVPYRFYRAENGELVPYSLTCTVEPAVVTTSQLCTAGGETFLTADGNIYKVQGG